MLNRLGRSVYLSSINEDMPPDFISGGMPVFLSLHIPEDYGDTFCQKAQRVCDTLYQQGCQIMADFSKHSLEVFGADDLPSLADRLHVYMARIDYGFSIREIADIAARMPVCLNAGTLNHEEAVFLAAAGDMICAMHNFYPRPETGLDADRYLDKTKMLQDMGLSVAAFIPGTVKRGPVYEGLPTIEEHRYIHPYISWAELVLKYHTDLVYVGDPGLDSHTINLINKTAETGILEIPCELHSLYRNLYGCVFTNRADAPAHLIRMADSRTDYSLTKEQAAPYNTIARSVGSITVDNELYLRYKGEMQITLKDFSADSKVNVIGHVSDAFMKLLQLVEPRMRFKLVSQDET